ncbi:MAG: hydrogenase iron-sulfur subunit [Deltaproteobacteria bacterium]
MAEEVYEPIIIGFLCNWCSYGGADLAGVSRLQYPANIRTIRTLCSATVGPPMILKAFQKGADGVFVGGCHIGDCHYNSGNYMTVKRIAFMHKLLAFMGIDPERVCLKWVSSAEGPRFAQVVTDFTEKIRGLGPSPLRRSSRSQAVRQGLSVDRAAL